jgi:hypothetical protein
VPRSRIDTTGEVIATLNRGPAKLEDIVFQAGIPIYTYGSATHGQDLDIAASSGAAFQLLPDGTRLCLAAQVLPYAPQFAISGEALGFELAHLGLGKDLASQTISTDIVADCVAIVNGLQHPHIVSLYRAKYCGAFRTGHGIRTKGGNVKAHTTREAAAHLGQAHLREGNDQADHAANPGTYRTSGH